MSKESRAKKADRMERRKENSSYYCWVINERTNYKKLVSKSKAFVMVHGVIDPYTGNRKHNLKDTYRVEDI